MIPDQYNNFTSSSAEKRIFELLKNDPMTKGWVVLHSLGLTHRGTKPYGEIDFVVMIPVTGIISLEIKGGGVSCSEGRWETMDRIGQKEKLRRSPFLQAREGMFALREKVLTCAPNEFPTALIFGYGVVMPDVSFNQKSPEWESWQVIDQDVLKKPISSALLRLAKEQSKFHPSPPPNEPSPATIQIVQQILRPDFEVVVCRGTQIADTEIQLLQLTLEQYNVIDLLSENERCLIEGSAGTGKTMLALEYARRSAMKGKRTLFVCFNRILGDWIGRQVTQYDDLSLITAGSFFKIIRDQIVYSHYSEEFLQAEKMGQTAELYNDIFPFWGQLAVEETKGFYDVLVLDEAQDLLQTGVLEVLNVWLKGGLKTGQWVIFGDFQRQAIFNSFTGEELKDKINGYNTQYVKGKLLINCRNTKNIGEETALLSGFDSLPYRLGNVRGLPVTYLYYDSSNNQRMLLYDTLCKMFSENINEKDIVIISHMRLVNSGVNNIDGHGHFRIIDINEQNVNPSLMRTVYFSTVQAFKGMESPVVILCDVDRVTDGEPQSILYVAMSRARSQLTVLLNDQTRPFITETVRRKLLKGWSKNV